MNSDILGLERANIWIRKKVSYFYCAVSRGMNVSHHAPCVCKICILLVKWGLFWEAWTFWLILTTSNSCVRVQTCLGVRLGLEVRDRGLVVMVSVRGWVLQYVYERKIKSTRVRVHVPFREEDLSLPVLTLRQHLWNALRELF